jgi:hypothetical protein
MPSFETENRQAGQKYKYGPNVLLQYPAERIKQRFSGQKVTENPQTPESFSLDDHETELQGSFWLEGNERWPDVEVTPIADGLAWKVDARLLYQRMNSQWSEKVVDVARKAPISKIQGGSVKTSLSPDSHETNYRVSGTETIAEELPLIREFNEGIKREIATRLTRMQNLYAGQSAHADNLNATESGEYDFHTDRNPVTGNTMVTTLEPEEGGKLVLWPPSVLEAKPNPSNFRKELTLEEQEKLARWGELRPIEKMPILNKTDLWERLHPKQGKPEIMPLVVYRPKEGEIIFFRGDLLLHEVTAFKPKDPKRIRVSNPTDFYDPEHPEVDDPEHDAKIGLNRKTSNA